MMIDQPDIEIVVCGSNSLVLVGLINILNQQENIQVVNSSLNQANLISAIECQPDLLMIEQPPDEDWWFDRWQLPSEFNLPVILLSDSLANSKMNEYLALGFKAFLPRLITVNEVIAAINAVMLGLIVIHPNLACCGEDDSAITPLAATEVVLTSRESEVLQLLADGLDNKAIALKLQISKHTVKFHISSILSKLDVSSRTEAVTLGLRRRIILL